MVRLNGSEKREAEKRTHFAGRGCKFGWDGRRPSERFFAEHEPDMVGLGEGFDEAET
jgi:hypothetical protein